MSSPLRILILTDTHSRWPYTAAITAPKSDVFIHCGDLTQVGGLASLKRAIADIKTIDAPLKLVIASNHDLDLDEVWVRRNMKDDADLDEHRECVDFMIAQKEFGIHYLGEGVHEFEVGDGRKLRVYASPYTSEFNGYAFAYGEAEDRFNSDAGGIPEDIDIAMTHGPPKFSEHEKYNLDANEKRRHLGCEKLARAMRRVKPRLHCFGLIHEGRGAMRIDCKGGGMSRAESIGLREKRRCSSTQRWTRAATPFWWTLIYLQNDILRY